MRNPLRIDTQAYLYEAFRDFQLHNYAVTRVDIDRWAAGIFRKYESKATGRVSFKLLYPMLYEFLRMNNYQPLREMDALWLAREFDVNGRGEATLVDFEMMLECLGGRVIQKWMVEQYRQSAEAYGQNWRDMFRKY